METLPLYSALHMHVVKDVVRSDQSLSAEDLLSEYDSTAASVVAQNLTMYIKQYVMNYLLYSQNVDL